MDRLIHILNTDILPPRQFTFPFCYEPHPLCRLAAAEVQRHIVESGIWQGETSCGKMFGVLVVREKGKVKSEESECGSEKGKVENEEGRGKNEESNYCDAVDAVLLVSWRKTKRYLLFNDDMKLVGWTNIETGEVRSPYPELNPKECRMYAFAGIHALSPRLLKMMDEFPDRFGIIDFYLKACATHNIKGYVKDDLKLMDIGKLDTLAQAEEFLKELGVTN